MKSSDGIEMNQVLWILMAWCFNTMTSATAMLINGGESDISNRNADQWRWKWHQQPQCWSIAVKVTSATAMLINEGESDISNRNADQWRWKWHQQPQCWSMEVKVWHVQTISITVSSEHVCKWIFLWNGFVIRCVLTIFRWNTFDNVGNESVLWMLMPWCFSTWTSAAAILINN